MFNLFKHVLPKGRAWRITTDKPLTRFFKGLGDAAQDVRTAFDEAYADLDPQSTRYLDAWEDQFNLPATTLTDQERRDRVDAAWKAQGGQSPYYIQNVLRSNGFDVYVHEWWVPQVDVARFAAEAGELVAEAGELLAEAGEPSNLPLTYPYFPAARDPFEVLGDDTTDTGYSLSCGAGGAVCGGVSAICGATSVATGKLLVNLPAKQVYSIPIDPEDWPYILYIGGETYGEKAVVAQSRQAEFEALILKLKPAQQWIGLIVEYT